MPQTYDILNDDGATFPGRLNSTGDNVGTDYGSLPGWALEHNAAPLVEYQAPQTIPTPSGISIGLVLAATLILNRYGRSLR